MLKFKTVWAAVYPNEAVPLDDKGRPLDLSNDARFQAPISPGLGQSSSAAAGGPSGRSSIPAVDTTVPHPAPSFPLPPSTSLPDPDLLGTADATAGDSVDATAGDSVDAIAGDSVQHHLSAPSTPLPPPPAPLPSDTVDSDARNLITYLRDHNFPITITPNHSRIEGGLFPGYNPLKPYTPCQRLSVIFVENPDTRIPVQKVCEAFISEIALEETFFDRIHSTLPQCIKKRRRTKDTPDDYVECAISSWVSQHSKIIHFHYINSHKLQLAVEMMRNPSAWQVTLTSWPDFLQTMVERKGEAWTAIMKDTHLIVGGLDFEADIL